MGIVVEQVEAALVLPLRQRVLRPHQRISEVRFAGDSAGTHFAAFDEESNIVGIASLIPESIIVVGGIGWRLRGMAVAEESQHRGIGRTIMAELLDFAARHDAPGIWCAARVPAIGFYERFGFFVASELYMEPEIGAHVRMERLSGATSPSLGGA